MYSVLTLTPQRFRAKIKGAAYTLLCTLSIHTRQGLTAKIQAQYTLLESLRDIFLIIYIYIYIDICVFCVSSYTATV